MYIYTVQQGVLLRRPHREPTPYNAIFFFFNYNDTNLQTNLVLNLEVKGMLKDGNLDL